MRILFFTPQQLWPVNSGSRLRNVHLASGLARRCPVTLLQILQPNDAWKEPPEKALFEELLIARKHASYTAGMVAKGMLGRVPVTVLNYESEDVSRCLRDTLASRQFDTVQMETSNLFSYLDIIRAAPGGPSVLLDWHNIDSELMARYATEAKSLPKRLVARRTASQLADLESRLLDVCDAHTVVSDRDRDKLLAINPRAKVSVIPNGVDAQAFTPSEDKAAGDKLLFVGSMDYHANVDAVRWFVEQVWPNILRRHPELKFTVVGRSPGPEIQTLASDTVEITGTVDDVRPYYANASAVVVPLRVGSGTRLKILEAMAMGVPVVSTKLGAEGIEVTDDKDILLVETGEQMTAAVGRILGEPALPRRLADAARKLVKENYDWQTIGDRLYAAHSELVESRAILTKS